MIDGLLQWLTLFTLIAGFATMIVAMLKRNSRAEFTQERLCGDLSQLTSNVDRLTGTIQRVKEDVAVHSQRLDDHADRIEAMGGKRSR